jgi:hypothetical protein
VRGNVARNAWVCTGIFEAGIEETNGKAFWRLTSVIRCLVVMGL